MALMTMFSQHPIYVSPTGPPHETVQSSPTGQLMVISSQTVVLLVQRTVQLSPEGQSMGEEQELRLLQV